MLVDGKQTKERETKKEKQKKKDNGGALCDLRLARHIAAATVIVVVGAAVMAVVVSAIFLVAWVPEKKRNETKRKETKRRLGLTLQWSERELTGLGGSWGIVAAVVGRGDREGRRAELSENALSRVSSTGVGQRHSV